MSDSLPVLYSFRRCPYAMRARMALHYSQIQYQHREIVLKDKPASMLKYSAKGTVPVLVVDGLVIEESLDVMLWALKKRDKAQWLKGPQQLALINMCDERFKSQLDQYKYTHENDESKAKYRKGALWYLALLDERLKQQSFLIADKISLADIAIFPFIRQFAFVDKNWFDNNQFQKLQKWLDKLINCELFLSIMQKQPLWNDEML